MGAENCKLEPVDLYLGNDQVQIQKISCVGDDNASLQNKRGFFYDKDGNKHFFQFNVATLGTPSVISGYTAHPVAIALNASANAVASALAAVLTAVTGFDAAASGYVVTLTHTDEGYALPAHDDEDDAFDTEFAFSMVQVGDLYESMGLLDGDVTVNGLSRKLIDITAHQHGADILGQILSGSGNPELSASLKEVTTENYKKLLRYSSGAYLPIGGSQELVGGGSAGQFGNPQSVKCVLHPIRFDVADKSADLCFWKTTLDLDQLAFSSEKIQNLPIKIKAFNDPSKPKAINTWVYGDWSQL
jgi:hypothetical protein